NDDKTLTSDLAGVVECSLLFRKKDWLTSDPSGDFFTPFVPQPYGSRSVFTTVQMANIFTSNPVLKLTPRLQQQQPQTAAAALTRSATDGLSLSQLLVKRTARSATNSFSYTVCQDKEFHILMNGFLETSSFQMYVNDSRDEGIKQRIMLSERNAEDNTLLLTPFPQTQRLQSPVKLAANRSTTIQLCDFEKQKWSLLHNQQECNMGFLDDLPPLITMRFNTLFFLLILSCFCFTLAQVSYEDCCLKYVKNLTNNVQKHAVSYRRQKTDGGCNIPAVIFIMRRGRKFCTDPNEKWVKELVLKIDEKNEKKFYYRAKSGFYGNFMESDRRTNLCRSSLLDPMKHDPISPGDRASQVETVVEQMNRTDAKILQRHFHAQII
ncbi:hypothetical protein CCH79_00009625, partial [Gambusia affinis]